jgi:mRNA-degrading endonuclease toxin of MazEF toxin-antitoxin module
VRRGEILWCDLEPRRGHEQDEVRPVLIVSADAYNESRSPRATVSAIAQLLTSQGVARAVYC